MAFWFGSTTAVNVPTPPPNTSPRLEVNMNDSMYTDPMVEQLVSKLTFVHEEMSRLRDVYLMKMKVLSDEKDAEILDLQSRLESYQKYVDDIQEQMRDQASEKPGLPRTMTVPLPHFHEGGVREVLDELEREHREIHKLEKKIKRLEHERHSFRGTSGLPLDNLLERETSEESIIDGHLSVEPVPWTGSGAESDEYDDEHDDELQQLRLQNMRLKKKLRRSSTQCNVMKKLLQNHHEKESLFNARKRQREREEKELREQYVLLELEQLAQHKDIIIDSLADSYRELRAKNIEQESLIRQLQEELEDAQARAN